MLDAVDVADTVDLQMQGTCGRGGLVNLWMRGTWWTVGVIKDLGIWKGRKGCVVVTSDQKIAVFSDDNGREMTGSDHSAKIK